MPGPGISGCHHSGGGLVRGLVLPDAQDRPSKRFERAVIPALTFHIPLKLGVPEFLIGRGSGAMVRAAVPEATVDEHGWTRPRERDVGAWRRSAGPDAISIAGAMQERPNGQFGPRISAPDPLHALAT